MKRKDLAEAADAIFALRPDDAYTVDEVIAQMRRFNGEVHVYKRGERTCVRSGAPATKMLLVLSGILHIKMPSELGDDILMGAFRPGDYVGTSLIYDPEKVHPFDVVAFSDAEVAVFDVDRVRAWRSDPRALPLFDHMGRQLCKLLAERRSRAVVLSGATIAERLRRYLAIRMQKEKSRTITVPGTEGDLANYLGVNKCALSRVVGKLTAEGKLTYKRNVITVNERAMGSG